VVADRYDRACVLFADIVNFTALASSRPPEETIGILDDIFTRFDRIADELNLEKIKTIGDAYMIVAGLPPERTADLGRVGDAALRMRQTIAEVAEARGLDLEIRAGLHFGPVVAGVIGRRKFLYDLWGDTVNVASRMESTASPGEIQASEAVYHRLHDEFTFEERGEVEIKGKGRMRIYRLLGRCDVALEPVGATPSLTVADPVAAAARPV
jgi:adenylate cyclase